MRANTVACAPPLWPSLLIGCSFLMMVVQVESRARVQSGQLKSLSVHKMGLLLIPRAQRTEARQRFRCSLEGSLSLRPIETSLFTGLFNGYISLLDTGRSLDPPNLNPFALAPFDDALFHGKRLPSQEVSFLARHISQVNTCA